MADKDFRINIGTAANTAGAEKAEKALRDVEGAAEKAGVEAGRLGANLGRTDGRVRPGAASAGGGASGGGLAGGLQATAAAAAETTNTGRKLGPMFQQAGYQVGDFAVQVGAGQNALVAFSQQGSQMLGMFGPGGAIAGALLAVGAAMFGAMAKSKKGAEDSAEALAEAAEKAREWNEAVMAGDNRAISEGLSELVEALDRENTAFERGIELRRTRRKLDLEMLAATEARQIAEVEADPDLSEAEKIRRTGAIRRAGAQTRRAIGASAIGEGMESARDSVQSAETRALRTQEAARESESGYTNAIRQRQQLEDRQRRFQALTEEMNQVGQSRALAGASLYPDQDTLASLRAREAALRDQRDRLGFTDDQQAAIERGEDLVERAGLTDEALKKLGVQVTETADAAQAATTALEEARKDLEAATRRAAMEREAAERIGGEQDALRGIQQRAKEDALPVYGPSEPPGGLDPRFDVSGTAGALRSAAERIAPSGVAARAARGQLFEVARQLDADSTLAAGEISTLVSLISEIGGRLGREGEARRRLQQQISYLEGQIRNMRDN